MYGNLSDLPTKKALFGLASYNEPCHIWSFQITSNSSGAMLPPMLGERWIICVKKSNIQNQVVLRLESLVIWYNFDVLWSFSIFELLRWQRLFCFLQMQVVETLVDKKGPPDTSLHPSIFMSSPSPGSDTHLQRLQLPELAELAQERHEFIHLKGWICATRLILEAS